MWSLSRNRFELALKELGPDDWKLFEELASDFLVEEFPDIRTVASSSGDKGRDSYIWSVHSSPDIVFQYSVSVDWRAKLMDTAAKISEKFRGTKMLVYMTNQEIGARGDDLITQIRNQFGLHLDIRDRSWFLERMGYSQARQAAAERVCRQIVDPLLAATGVIESKGAPLGTFEARAALVHMGMQLEDDARDKGLTKLAFEALVRAALTGSSPDNRFSRYEIHERVRAAIGAHDTEGIARFVDGALERLKKRYVKHWQKEDTFCLAHEERQRLDEELVAWELADQELRQCISNVVDRVIESLPRDSTASPKVRTILPELVRVALESLMLEGGERFADAVVNETMLCVDDSDLSYVVTRILARDDRVTGRDIGIAGSICIEAIRLLYREDDDTVAGYLRALSDSYTLLAFLQMTPDVQRVVKKLFSAGEVWLDTSIILPLLAEQAADECWGGLGRLIAAARRSGMRFHVTNGVVEEVTTHIQNSASEARMHAHRDGKLPFLLSAFLACGRSITEFPLWAEEICGTFRPEDDARDYLLEEFGIGVQDLDAEISSRIPESVRLAVLERWQTVHEERRTTSDRVAEPVMVRKLADHDTENYLGVVALRKSERPGALGYGGWFLTLDHEAFRMLNSLSTEVKGFIVHSPVMSIDFLARYMSLGPGRPRTADSVDLPFAIADFARGALMPSEVIETANDIRAKYASSPERVIRRQVRDALDRERMRIGILPAEGPSALSRGSAK